VNTELADGSACTTCTYNYMYVAVNLSVLRLLLASQFHCVITGTNPHWWTSCQYYLLAVQALPSRRLHVDSEAPELQGHDTFVIQVLFQEAVHERTLCEIIVR